MGGFHNLYPEAVCKLHICCVRMNIISGSLAKGGGLLALGGKLLEYAASCVTVRDLPLISPTQVCNYTCCSIVSQANVAKHT